MTEKKFSWWTEQSRYTLLIFGVVLVYFGISELPTIWTSKSELTQLKGTIQSARTYVTTVSDTSRYGYIHYSQKAELIFYLYEYKQKYYLAENIGNDKQDDKYETIFNGLNHSDTISVWIKKTDLHNWQPKVFQIDNDNSTLLDFDTARLNHSPLFLILTILGAGSIVLFFWADNPIKIRRAFGIKD